MATATMETETAGSWRMHKPGKHGAGRSTRRPLRAHGDPHGDAAGGPGDDAAQGADVARAAARAERRRPAQAAALYRIVQEALANVVKHAHATRATVTLVQDATVRLQVDDDGVGFGAPTPGFAYGLAGMVERVAALGGRLHLDNG